MQERCLQLPDDAIRAAHVLAEAAGVPNDWRHFIQAGLLMLLTEDIHKLTHLVDDLRKI